MTNNITYNDLRLKKKKNLETVAQRFHSANCNQRTWKLVDRFMMKEPVLAGGLLGLEIVTKSAVSHQVVPRF